MCAQRRLRSACASAQSDQSSLSAWRNFASLAIQNPPSEDSDQTAQMRRLIWIFSVRTCPKVRFLTLRLIIKDGCQQMLPVNITLTVEPIITCACTLSDLTFLCTVAGSLDTREGNGVHWRRKSACACTQQLALQYSYINKKAPFLNKPASI